jgi:hypothetical protein
MPSLAPRALAPTCVALAAVVSVACVNVDSQGHTVREEHRFKLTGQPDVRLTTFDGSIEIRSWDQPEVLVEVEKRGPTQEALDRLEVKIGQQDNRIDVEARRPLGSESFIGIGLHVSPHVRLVATIPRKAAIVARSGDGSIRVERVAGRVDLRTGDGSIRAEEVSGELTLNTGDGSVVLDRIDGSVEITTGDGGVSVSGRITGARVETGDGSVTLRAEEGSAMSGDWSLTTNDGGVVLYLPEDFNADLDAHTGERPRAQAVAHDALEAAALGGGGDQEDEEEQPPHGMEL